MITTSDIADILFRDCRVFGIAEIYRRGSVKEQSPGTRWLKDFVEVNLCVPDIADGVADLGRLQELERQAKTTLDRVTGMFDGTRYSYSISDLDGTAEDSENKCHYVNVRLLFNVLNVN